MFASATFAAIESLLPDCGRIEHNGTGAAISLAAQHRVEKAAELLGHPFSLEGEIQHGKQIGRKLGFPTANLVPDALQLLPRFGVYAARVMVEGQVLMGVTSVGVRPTFEQNAQPNVETLILDFDDTIYHETMRIEFLRFIRPELRFERVEDLIAQIRDDEAQTRRIFQNGS